MSYPAILRMLGTIAISVLASMQVLYPSFTWIAVAIAALGAVGIHAIPAISQATTLAVPAITTEVKNMETSSELESPVGVNGMALMGLTPPVTAQKTADQPTPVAESAPEPTPVATPQEPVELVSEPTPVDIPVTAQKTATPVSEPVTVVSPSLAEILANAATALSAAAEALAKN